MSEESDKLKEQVNWPLRIVIGVIVTILIIGGSVAAYIAISSTPKNKYFLAESSSMNSMKDVFKDRYEDELNWREQSKTKPAKSTYELSAEYNDPASGFDLFDPAQFINHSTVTITNEQDTKDKKQSTKINANLANIDTGDFSFYATDEQLMVDLPFSEDLLSINSEDMGSFLHNIDPAIDPNEEFDLNILFDGPESIVSDEQKEHIKEEYIKMIYKELPEDSFTSSKETIEVHDQSIKAEKIEFHLSEEELKDLFTLTIDKLSKDGKIKDMIRDTLLPGINFGRSLSSIDPQVLDEIDRMMNMYEEALQEAKNEVGFMVFKDGMTSTLWIHENLIVQREFDLKVGTSEEDLVTLNIDGTQLLEKEEQVFDYNLAVSNNYDQGSMNISASFTDDQGDSSDSITLAMADEQVSYNSEESLKDNERKFERSIAFEDDYDDPVRLVWSGSAAYDGDQMNSDHLFYLDYAELNKDFASLQLTKDAKLVKQVGMAEDESTKDLGSLNASELDQYIEHDIPMQFEQWLFDILGGKMLDF